MDNKMETDSNFNDLKKVLKTWGFWKPFVAIILGGTLGFLYYFFVGCNSGQCAITSNPYSSIVMGGLFGLFLVKSPCSQNKC
jgi:hypothetical protein